MPIDTSEKLNYNQKLISGDSAVIMGILNVTPDSFSDGGLYIDSDIALEHAITMQQEGAHIIDIGGESTRPGAEAVNAQEEIDRIVPVIEKISANSEVLISVDTSKPEVMRVAVEAGASMVNDVNALQAAGAVEVCAELKVVVCLMHMQGEPRTMQTQPQYDDVVSEVSDFLKQRAQACIEQGIDKNHIILDPGFGFGKKLEHNLLLLQHFDRLCSLNFPVLMGISRKSMLGQITGQTAENRLIPSLAAVAVAYQKGGRIFRVHNVKETRETLLLCEAVNNPDGCGASS